MILLQNDTICALSTAAGKSAIALIRVTGPDSFAITERIFSKSLHDKKSHTAHFGKLHSEGRWLDDVVVTVFHGPHSFTGEDTAEIACHGSAYIQQEIIQALLAAGCRLAQPGEFSFRAFANGKVDLTQAEAIADLIDADSRGAHQLALSQMKGGFSKEIGRLREKLIDFAALIELELDFAEEDVEFADRSALQHLLDENTLIIGRLVQSFSLGNAIKNGVPVAIVGAPNAGKSTLLNSLLNEERAIVSEIAGTTRDAIEDDLYIGSLRFRFIDTAGIRSTTDTIENLGIEKTFEKASQARIILYLVDSTDHRAVEQIEQNLSEIRALPLQPTCDLIVVWNKVDSAQTHTQRPTLNIPQVNISAKTGQGMEDLKHRLIKCMEDSNAEAHQVVVTNIRHLEALQRALEHLLAVQRGLQQGITGDFLALDIRQALHHLGSITGEINNEHLLDSIFTRFCIGK
ncbi:MAG TPA: tRNA uridine-5-carboxymethylaminomethyl(34) synthesis GTPase MnmE [Luteibaculaceae bacterium]|nr:tRNA uridine-5-carboxymethylaminomethyl(34) synthesis GTPase MnmE [Luteibaculaceae bacterium]